MEGDSKDGMEGKNAVKALSAIVRAGLYNPSSKAKQEKKRKKRGFWLNAWNDPLANARAYTDCVRFGDITANGDYHLIVATLENKLKIFRGVQLASEHKLIGEPTVICTFYIDSRNANEAPAVAVCSGPYVFIYRNLRPYFKFTIPPIELDEREIEIWQSVSKKNEEKSSLSSGRKTGKAITRESLYGELERARDDGVPLSIRSLELLSIEDPVARTLFIDQWCDKPLIQKTVITCMETLAKDSDAEVSTSRLVIGTENRFVLLVNPVDCSILVKCHIPAVPVIIATVGVMDVDYRILICSRDGQIFTIRNGEVSGKVIELESPPVGLVALSKKELVVATSDSKLHSYNMKGHKNYTISMPKGTTITNIALFSNGKMEKNKAVLAALSNGEVKLFKDKHCLDTFKLDDTVMGMRCGRYGREECCLALTHRSGAVSIRILRRKASLDTSGIVIGPPPEQEVPLNLPKKTKLFIQQTEREREQGIEMHRIFQRDLSKLRLESARSYVKLITTDKSLSYSKHASVRLNASVQGLGPLFTIEMTIQNMGRKPLCNVPVVFGYKHDLYHMERPAIIVPLLVPELLYSYQVRIRSMHSSGAAGTVRAFVVNHESSLPIITATIQMPLSEVETFD
eukprot:g1548.t1